MIGKANPRDLAFGALRLRHTRVQKNVDTGVLANLVENPLDGFGIEDQEDAAMPLRRRDGAHRAELGNYGVGYAGGATADDQDIIFMNHCHSIQRKKAMDLL